jgi:hypothetical protein
MKQTKFVLWQNDPSRSESVRSKQTTSKLIPKSTQIIWNILEATLCTPYPNTKILKIIYCEIMITEIIIPIFEWRTYNWTKFWMLLSPVQSNV